MYSIVWGLQTYDEQERHSTVLVNKVLRSLNGLEHDVPSSLLSYQSGQLSVHQRTALFTLTSVHKALGAKEPSFSYSTFKKTPSNGQPVRLKTNSSRVNYKLSIS